MTKVLDTKQKKGIKSSDAKALNNKKVEVLV